MDARFKLANGRIAEAGLRGEIEAAKFATVAARRVVVSVADVCDAPRGNRMCQAVSGSCFEVLETRDGWCFGRRARDGYVGYMRENQLGDWVAPSDWVTARNSHVYQEPDIKSRDIAPLSFGAELTVARRSAGFVALTGGGFVPAQHVAPIRGDYVDTAQQFIGTPYLWGGNSGVGIDCSGLVQVSLWAQGIAAPRDSDLQRAQLGKSVPSPRRGDLIFWRGHVAIMVDDNTILHANAHHMAVAIEPYDAAVMRIAQKEFGEVLDIKRL